MLQSNEKIIKHKVGLLNLAEELGNVSRACQIMGLSRGPFYRYRDAEEGGVAALPAASVAVSRTGSPETENTVVTPEYPAHGQVRVSNELRSEDAPRSTSSRLKALEAKVAEDGIILTARRFDEAWGEIETAHPGYRALSTFYVGTLKGVGRYQQTYIDTYAKIAQAKLYKTKTPITAADMLNDKVLPFHEERLAGAAYPGGSGHGILRSCRASCSARAGCGVPKEDL